jgi:TfoX/Sxy family transcriptional regulator of competence genes
MPYDEDLANRLRELLADEDAITEKKMFGGLAFLLNGHMSVSASGKGGLLVRLDPSETDAALKRDHVERMEMGGRSMDGWLRVAPEGVRTKRQLQPWVKRSVMFVKTLRPK